MTPEQYLERAEEHYAAGRFAEAAACAGIAAARAAVAGLRAAEPLPIHPGDHRPQPIAWCGRCRDTHHRVTPDHQPCPRCSADHLRARPCRYCGVYLEERREDASAPWRWVDARGSRGCPDAPDPLQPPPVPELEPDLASAAQWARLLDVWREAGDLADPVTADHLCEHRDTVAYVPRTRFGEMPHPRQLDAWLHARADVPLRGADDCPAVVVRRTGDADGHPRWTVAGAE